MANTYVKLAYVFLRAPDMTRSALRFNFSIQLFSTFKNNATNSMCTSVLKLSGFFSKFRQTKIF